MANTIKQTMRLKHTLARYKKNLIKKIGISGNEIAILPQLLSK